MKSTLCVSLILLGTLAGVSQTGSTAAVHHVSSREPVLGVAREKSAERTAEPEIRKNEIPQQTPAHNWTLQATLTGAVIHDLAFPTAQVGYIAAELGQVWKTTDGGSTWSEILNLGFPYYWYGVYARTANDVVISGFNDQNFEGIIRWSSDGGTTWSSDVVLTTTGWSDRVRFANVNDGIVMDQLNLDAANADHYTTDGGATAADWTAVVPDASGGWFGDQFSFLSDLHTRASGINYCMSPNGGQTWRCGPPVDSVFDGPVFFLNDTYGWVGGGEISPAVEGWLHVTTNGGKNWSGRTLNAAWPIREILFLNAKSGWAAGGNIYTNVGGIYFSSNGGQTWTLDVNTGAEMHGCASQKLSGGAVQIWCAGSNGALNGLVYTLLIK